MNTSNKNNFHLPQPERGFLKNKLNKTYANKKKNFFVT